MRIRDAAMDGWERNSHQQTPQDDLISTSQNVWIEKRLQLGMEKVQLLATLNVDDDLLSSERWGSAIWEQALCAVSMDNDNHILFAGYYLSHDKTDTHLLLAKMCAKTQTIIWAKQYLTQDDDEICKMLLTADNDILLVGTINSLSINKQCFMVMKISAAGEVQYRRAYETDYVSIACDAVISRQGKKCLVIGSTGYTRNKGEEQHGMQIFLETGEIDWLIEPRSYTAGTSTRIFTVERIDSHFNARSDDSDFVRWLGDMQSGMRVDVRGGREFNAESLAQVQGEFTALAIATATVYAEIEAASVSVSQLILSVVKSAVAVFAGAVDGVMKYILSNMEVLQTIYSGKHELAAASVATLDAVEEMMSSYANAHAGLGIVPDKTEILKAAKEGRKVSPTHSTTARRLVQVKKVKTVKKQQDDKVTMAATVERTTIFRR